MCGIIGAFNLAKKDGPVNKWVRQQMDDQIDRGKEGFGMVFIRRNGKHEIERATELVKAMSDLYYHKSQMIIAHHRMPTSTPNKISQTHPILVDHGSLKSKYYVVHNGIIRNAYELHKKHTDELGFVYTTEMKVVENYARSHYLSEKFNDSESLAIELARYIEGQTEEIGAFGSMAFIVLEVDKDDNQAKKVYFGRTDSSPLRMSATRGKIRLSSEGEGHAVEPFFLYNFELSNLEINKAKLKVKEEPKTITTWKRSLMDDDDDDVKVATPEPVSDFEYSDYQTTLAEMEQELKNPIEEFIDSLTDEDMLFMMDINKEVEDRLEELKGLMHSWHEKMREEVVRELQMKASIEGETDADIAERDTPPETTVTGFTGVHDGLPAWEDETYGGRREYLPPVSLPIVSKEPLQPITAGFVKEKHKKKKKIEGKYHAK